MIPTRALVACFAAAVFAGSGVSLAAAEPEAPPPIDWRDFIDTDMNGDHVVGEELCTLPGAVEPIPSPFVIV